MRFRLSRVGDTRSQYVFHANGKHFLSVHERDEEKVYDPTQEWDFRGSVSLRFAQRLNEALRAYGDWSPTFPGPTVGILGCVNETTPSRR